MSSSGKVAEDVGGWFVHLPETAQEVARSSDWMRLSVFNVPGYPPIRCAELENGSNILDPVGVAINPRAWTIFHGRGSIPAMNVWRMEQACQNYHHFGFNCSLEHNQWKDKPAYIVGNGPSARIAHEVIPARSRNGKVIAINGAAHLFPSDMDIWFTSCALWPDGCDDWLEALLCDWRSFGFWGCDVVASPYANSVALESANVGGANSINFFDECNQNPFRTLTEGAGLPTFISGMQGIVSAINLAYWLGCNPIVLFGVDEGRPVGHRGLHSIDDVGWRPSAVTEWAKVEGIGGKQIETTQDLMLSAQHVSALSMWINDAGVDVVNCSEGLDLIFAPHVEADELVRSLES